LRWRLLRNERWNASRARCQQAPAQLNAALVPMHRRKLVRKKLDVIDMVVFMFKALSTLATTVAAFGDSRRKRRQIVAVSGDCSRQCGQGLIKQSASS